MKYIKKLKIWAIILVLVGLGYYAWCNQQPEQLVDLNDPKSVKTTYVEKHRMMSGYQAAAKYPELRNMTYRITINGQDLHIPIPYFATSRPVKREQEGMLLSAKLIDLDPLLDPTKQL